MGQIKTNLDIFVTASFLHCTSVFLFLYLLPYSLILLKFNWNFFLQFSTLLDRSRVYSQPLHFFDARLFNSNLKLDFAVARNHRVFSTTSRSRPEKNDSVLIFVFNLIFALYVSSISLLLYFEAPDFFFFKTCSGIRKIFKKGVVWVAAAV